MINTVTISVFTIAILHSLFAKNTEKTIGLWAGFFLIIQFVIFPNGFINKTYSWHLLFEPSFVAIIVFLMSSPKILNFIENNLMRLTKVLPFHQSLESYFFVLFLGPLLGSFITEPGAITISSLILLELFYQKNISEKFKYLTLVTLLVNTSIGGSLTSFAAPPIIMVARHWGWNTPFVFTQFGIKAVLIVLINTTIATVVLKKEIIKIPIAKKDRTIGHKNIKERFHEAFLIFIFLFGLIILGKPQSFWIQKIIANLSNNQIYLGSIFFTSFFDNAALTFLGTTIPNLSSMGKYFLVAGSLVGGGLTILANAPNPIAFQTLEHHFKFNPIKVFIYALLPTIIATIVFYL